jgi:kumamolisin
MASHSNEARSDIPGSEREPLAGAVVTGELDPVETVGVTIVLRGRASSTAAAQLVMERPMPERRYVDRKDFAATYGADPEDIRKVEAFLREAGLHVSGSHAARRSVFARGPLAAVEKAFGARVSSVEHEGQTFRGRVGALSVPHALSGIVVGVFGIDNRPQARAQFRRKHKKAASNTSYTPPQVAQAYRFPSGADGTGQTIALIELGGGYVQSDLDTYFTSLGVGSPAVTSVATDGVNNAPAGDPNSADGEVMLDIEVVGSIAPGVAIVVYFAPNTDQGFLDAVTAAIHDTKHAPNIVSISWGGPESTWTQQALTNFDAAFADAALLGVSVFVAAGDSGSTDGVSDGAAHVDFPASSPHVTACGGTRLNVTGTTRGSETVWNDGASGGATGGGISDVFAVPTYQSTAGVPPSANANGRVGRGVPDVAGDADPETGYQTRIDGTNEVVGGTSAVAPLWAALTALGNQSAGKPLGFLNPGLYANPSAFNDITKGSNGAYSAKSGWDPCTGLGTPDGVKIIAALTKPS